MLEDIRYRPTDSGRLFVKICSSMAKPNPVEAADKRNPTSFAFRGDAAVKMDNIPAKSMIIIRHFTHRCVTLPILLLGSVASSRWVCRADNPVLDSQSHPLRRYNTLPTIMRPLTRPRTSIVDIDLSAPAIQFRVTPQVAGLPDNPSGTRPT